MRVIRLYINYFFSKSNIILYTFFIAFISFSYYFSINDLNDSLSYNEVISFYYQNCIYYTKIIVVFVSIIQFSKLYTERNQYILNFVIASGYNKKQNYNYMLISLIMINAIFICFLYLLFIIIGVFSKSYFVSEVIYARTFLNIFLISNIYGVISYLVSLIFDNHYFFIIILILYLISDLFMANNNIISYTYFYIFPNIKDNGELIYNYFYILFEFLLLFFLTRKKYLFVDLKN